MEKFGLGGVEDSENMIVHLGNVSSDWKPCRDPGLTSSSTITEHLVQHMVHPPSLKSLNNTKTRRQFYETWMFSEMLEELYLLIPTRQLLSLLFSLSDFRTMWRRGTSTPESSWLPWKHRSVSLCPISVWTHSELPLIHLLLLLLHRGRTSPVGSQHVERMRWGLRCAHTRCRVCVWRWRRQCWVTEELGGNVSAVSV